MRPLHLGKSKSLRIRKVELIGIEGLQAETFITGGSGESQMLGQFLLRFQKIRQEDNEALSGEA